jgi:hypothetical protein
VLVSALNGEIITMLSEMVKADEHNQRPLRACYEIWMQVMANLLLSNDQVGEKESLFQSEIEEKMRNHASSILSAVISHINAASSTHDSVVESQKQQARRKEQESVVLMRLISHLMQLTQEQP